MPKTRKADAPGGGLGPVVFYTKSAQFAASTSAGNQDLTVSGSDTPSAVIIEVSSATTAGTAIAGMRIGIGISDGTNSRAFSIFSENSAGPSNCGGRNSATALVELVNPTATTQDGRATFSTWLNSGGSVGVRINWSNPPSTAVLLNATFFFGATEALVTTVTTGSTIGDEAEVTSMSNRPNFCFGTFGSTGAAFNGFNRSVGYAVDDGGSAPYPQACKIINEQDNQGVTTCAGELVSDMLGGLLTSVTISGGSESGQVELTSWTPSTGNGAVFTTRTANVSIQGAVLLLAIPSDQKLGLVVTDTDTDGTTITDNAGTHTVEFGFEPIHLSVIGTGHQDVDDINASVVGPWSCYGHAQSSSSRVVATCQVKDNDTTSDTRGYADTAFCATILLNTGAVSYTLDLNSFSGVGAALDVDTAANAAFYNIYVAVGQPEVDRVLTETVAIADQAILEPTLTSTETVAIADDATLVRVLSTTETVAIADDTAIVQALSITEGVSVADDTTLTQGLSATEGVAVADNATLVQGLSATEEIGITDAAITVQGLSTTEGVSISDEALIEPTLEASESVLISEDVALVRGLSVGEDVFVSDSVDLVLSNVAMDIIVDSEAVAISDGVSFSWVLLNTEGVGISDGADLALSNVPIDVTEGMLLLDRKRLFASGIMIGTESVGVADALVAHLGEVFVAAPEDVFIADSAAFGDGLVMMKSGGGARQTAIGGAELGATQQGGGARGEVNR